MTRRGKYLILTLDSQVKVAFHLRMTGQLLYQPRETPLAKHTTLRVSLNDGFDLRMVDQRKFGTINIFAPDGAGLAPCGLLTLGPEPFDVDALFSLKKAARRRKGPVKEFFWISKYWRGWGTFTLMKLCSARELIRPDLPIP